MMIFHVSDFNEICPHDLAEYILQFVINTTKPGEQVELKFTNEITKRSPLFQECQAFYRLSAMLPHAFIQRHRSKKIQLPSNWIEMLDDNIAITKRS